MLLFLKGLDHADYIRTLVSIVTSQIAMLLDMAMSGKHDVTKRRHNVVGLGFQRAYPQFLDSTMNFDSKSCIAGK